MRVTLALLLLVVGCAKSPKTSPRGGARTKPAQTTMIPEGLGFYGLDAGVPAPVAAAADSTFFIMVLGEASGDEVRQIDASNGGARAFKEKILASEAGDMDKTVVIKQIENCEAYKNVEDQKTCVVVMTSYNATGFLAGDGKTLWTNAHVVEHSLKYIAGLQKTSVDAQLEAHGRVATYVFSRDGRLLVNPNVDPVTLRIVPPRTALAVEQSNFYAEDSDYAALALSKPIGTPLKLTRQIDPADRLFVLGYPGCTKCAPPQDNPDADDVLDYSDRAPRPNSNGRELKVTSGVAVAREDTESFFELGAATFKDEELSRMLFTTADSQHGNSGGPVLNARGEVVAIHAGGRSRIIDGAFTRISRAVIPREF